MVYERNVGLVHGFPHEIAMKQPWTSALAALRHCVTVFSHPSAEELMFFSVSERIITNPN